MRYPSPSIFEPLFLQDEQLQTPPCTHLTSSCSSEWLSSAYSAPDPASRQLRTAPATAFSTETCFRTTDIIGSTLKLDLSPQTITDPAQIHPHGHGKLPSSFITDRTVFDALMANGPPLMANGPPSRSLSSPHVGKHDDDGSVATKLLASITKSISSPALLSCCKEPTRETPYQKTLKLRMMKLQHCAEELGSESSDCTLTFGDGGSNNSFDSLFTMSSSLKKPETAACFSVGSSASTMPQMDRSCECDESPMMTSVMSAPNLRCSSLMSKYAREKSFPPPLSHRLPRSVSSDSFAISLRAYREDGRFMLKEVKVPCQQYLQANRKDGRLTLELFTADDGVEEEDNRHKELKDAAGEIGVNMGDATLALYQEGGMGCGYGDNLEVESASTGDAEEGLEDIGAKGSVDVDMNEIVSNMVTSAMSDVRKDGELGAKGLLMVTGGGNCGVVDADDVSEFGTFCTRKSEFSRAKHKPWNRPSVVCLRVLSSSWKLGTLAPGNIPRLKVAPFTRLSESEESLVLQKSSLISREGREDGRNSMLEVEILPASVRGVEFGTDGKLGLSQKIVFKDVDRNSVKDMVKKLVSSFQIDGCPRKGLATRGLPRSGCKSVSTQLKGSITSINIGVRKLNTKEAVNSDAVNLKGDIELRRIDAFEEAGGCMSGVSSSKPGALHVDVQIPLPMEWMHNLHCRELFGRSQFAGNKGFSWVAIRS